MKLRDEFVVAVPIDRVWETLLDIGRVARFLPGATVEPTEDEDVYRGSMKMRVGPMVVHYAGTARLGAVNERERWADIEVEAREARGQGTASAVIHNQLNELDGRTRVVAETEVSITGRQAQFGRGIMQDVASNVIGEFARRFERHLLEGDPATGAASADDTDMLDVVSALSGARSLRQGAAGLAGAAALVLVAVSLRRRRKRVFEIRFTHAW